MVTDRPGLALGIVTADCAPVLFADAGGHIVGAAHAGWRGAVAGVLEATVVAMTALGASAAGITAAVAEMLMRLSVRGFIGSGDRRPVPGRPADGDFARRRLAARLAPDGSGEDIDIMIFHGASHETGINRGESSRSRGLICET